MALRKLDMIGAAMRDHRTDDEFERLQRWFHPKRIRRILQEWHARYEPWIYEHPDERGMPSDYRQSEVVAELKRGEVAGDVQRALNQLAMREPVLYDVILGFYLDVQPVRTEKEHGVVITWEPRQSVFELAEWQGCSPRTVYRREEKARYWMAEWLGWERPSRNE